MLSKFEQGKLYKFDIIEAINNNMDTATPGWLVKNMIQYDGQHVRWHTAELANLDGIMVYPHWCKEVSL